MSDYIFAIASTSLIAYQVAIQTLVLIQWTPSNPATGASRSVLIRGVASFQGWIGNYYEVYIAEMS